MKKKPDGRTLASAVRIWFIIVYGIRLKLRLAYKSRDSLANRPSGPPYIGPTFLYFEETDQRASELSLLLSSRENITFS